MNSNLLLRKCIKLFFLCCFLVISTKVIGQQSKILYNNSLTQPIVFYGFDFSHVKLLDKKRSADELKDFIPKLSKHLYKVLPSDKFETALKEKPVIFNLSATYQMNNAIIDSTILTKKRHRLDKDSLQGYISNYNIPDSAGTGVVIMYECFQRRSDTTTAYLIFFDISTRNIINTEYIQNHDGNGYGRLTDWHHAAYVAAIRVIEEYAYKTELSHTDINRYKILTTQDSLQKFKPGFFKNSIDELPVTFGIGPGIGISSSFISAGINMNVDIYHILIGFRFTLNPLIPFMAEESRHEYAFYTGYRYRKYKDAFSIGAGMGQMQINCSSGLNSDCENFKDEEVLTLPVLLEYAYSPNHVVGLTLSINMVFSERVNTVSLLGGVKFGLSRRPQEIFIR